MEMLHLDRPVWRVLIPMIIRITLPAYGALLAVGSLLHAQELPPRQKLGTVSFATSCTPAAQPIFNRAVSLLHSFEFRHAMEGFNQTLQTDPACGIAYWGIALSAWGNPFAPGIKPQKQIQAGLDAVKSARAAGSGTQREKDYVAAVSLLYENAGTMDQQARLAAYRDAMTAL